MNNVMIILVTMSIAIGCATPKQQGEQATVMLDVPETPSTEKQTQPGKEMENQSNVLPVDALKARECTLQVLEEYGETVMSSEENTSEIVTQFKFIDLDKLQKIASVPEQNKKIRWQKGGYNLRLHIYPVSENSTTLEISIRIIGNLETSLPLLRPSTYQTLPSRGTLEQEIYNAILKCCEDNSPKQSHIDKTPFPYGKHVNYQRKIASLRSQ
ncbi:MAG: hypothetical protein U0586_06885 [Candidatus Brocadiaceae bacterium]